MLILVGLGNPGAKYARNRHNIGFMAVDEIHRHFAFQPWQKKFTALIAEGRIGTKKVLLMKPQTFMNNSGQAVGEAMRFYKLAPSDITTLYDELDLLPGKVRIKTGGGHGGHNGIKSIDAHCGKDYHRVRLGIGHPGHKDRVHAHVLGDFAKADQSWLEPLLDAIGRHAELLVEGNNSAFMNKIALATGNDASDQTAAKPAQKPNTAKSHIHQARSGKPQSEPSGPMADMLKKLLGK